MAKDLLLNVLVDILGNYVAGLTKENLKIGVWAGKIELFNLKLKSTALDQFHLPVQVNKGSLQKLKLKIPWASLDKKPVKVIIDGIYLEACPIDLMKLSSSEIKSMILSTKLKILEQAEQTIINMMQNKESIYTKLKKTSYLQQLTSKILDNIEFQITNIHIRYIDDQSMPGLTFSTGFMVESLVLNTTDENWCSAFINRSATTVDTEKTDSPAIHKLGTIKNMSIYWNTISDGKPLSTDLDQNWEKKMYAMIYSQKEYVEESEYLDTKNESMVYILYPFNECTVKIIHRQVCNEFTPNADVIVESGTLDFNMNEKQYQQLIAANKYFTDLDRKKFLISHRPLKRPTEDPRSWWHYAYKLIVKKEVILGSKMHLMVDCMRAKSIYVPYYKKVITYHEILRFLDLSDEEINKYKSNLLNQQPLEIKTILAEIPWYVVVTLHQQATREAVVEIQKLKADPQLLQLFLDANDILLAVNTNRKAIVNIDSNTTKTKSSIFSMFRSSKTSSNQDINKPQEQIKSVATDVEDEIAMSKLEAVLEQVSITSNEQQVFSLRLQLISNTTLQVGFTAKPIAKINMACKAQLEVRHQDLVVSFEVERLDITDLVSNDPVSNRIVSVMALPYTTVVKATDNIIQSYFQLEITLKPNKSFLLLKSKPILLLLNEPFMNQSILFFTSAYTSTANTIQDKSIYKRTMKNSSYATSFNVYAENNLDIHMEIFAPVILIPEKYNSPHCGTLRLEAGPIIVNGNIDKTCVTCQINAQDLNITMPKNYYSEYCKLLNITDTSIELINKKTSMNTIKNIVDLDNRFESNQDHNSYLVKPFSVLCEVGMLMGCSNAGISLKVAILSQVDMQVDPIKLIRLESLFQIVYRSIVSHILRANSYTRAANSTSTSFLFVEDINFTKVNLDFQLLIPKAICSIYTINSSRDIILELSFNEIQTTIIDRVADINIEFGSKSITIKDSAQRSVLITPDHTVLKVVYRQFKCIGSPIYNGYARELSILCSTEVLINLEAKTILTISQYISDFNELYITYLENYVNNLDQQPLISMLVSDNMIRAVPNSTIVNISLNSIGINISEEVETLKKDISVVLLATQNEFAFYICAKNILLCFEQNDIMFKKHYSDQPLILDTSLLAKDVILKIGVTMTDLIIQDIRSNSSRSHCYNTIITSNRAVSLLDHENNDVSADNTINNINNSINNNINNINNNSNNNNINNNSSNKVIKSEHLLSISIHRKAQNLNIEINCEDIHAFITPEPLLALIKSSILIMDAIKILYESILNNHWVNNNRNINNSNNNSTHNIKTILDNTNQSNSICLNITCSFINPKLFILENPENKNTKAFLFDGNIKYVYIHNASINLNASNFHLDDGSKQITSNELNELIYISLTNAQLLVLNDICIDSMSHKIIEPLWIDIQIKRNSENNIILMNDLKITSDGMLSTVSLNDLALSMSIIKKAKSHMIDIFGNNNNNNSNNNIMEVKYNKNNSYKKPLEFKSVAIFKIFINIKQIQLMLINDCSNQNELPIFRASIKDIEATLNGTLSNLEGECVFILSMEYFNSLINYSMSYWEPIIEPWQPTILISHDFNGLQVVLDSDRIFQVNLSGTILRCIHETILLVSKIDKEGISFESKTKRYPITIHNELGIPILLYGNKTKQEIKSDDHDKSVYRISVERNSSSSIDTSSEKATNKHSGVLLYEDSFDIHLTGELALQRQPVLQASIYSTKPKRYKLQLVNTLAVTVFQHKQQKNTEPLQEEIFENQRYYPLKGAWAEPWTNMGDPDLFTDVRGQICKNPKSFICPKDWHWVESDWKIDIGKVGVETDREGWQYETIFGAFSTSRFKRRSQLPLDSVRRRRWVRSRLPIQKPHANTSISSISTDPWMLYWDVYMRSDDVREIYISSGVHIRNELPYSLEIEIVDAAGMKVTDEISSQRRFLVDGKNIFGVPINLLNVNHIKLRPFDMQFDWSENIVYKQQSKVVPTDKFDSKMQRVVCMNMRNNQPFYLTIHIVHTLDKKTVITCSSSLIIANRLPCPISILCMNPSTTNFGGTVRCSTAMLEPGSFIDESHIDVHQTISLNLSVGSYSSLEPVEICYDEEQCKSNTSHIIYNEQVLLSYHNNNKNNPELMTVTLKSVLSKLGVLEIYIYSQYLLVDLSYCNIIITTDWFKGHIESNSSLIDMFSSKSSVKDDASMLLIKRYSYLSSHRSNGTSDISPSSNSNLLLKQSNQLGSKDISPCWASGSSGVSLFQSNKENKISLGINAGGGWLSNLSLNSLTRNKTPIEIVDSTTKNACNIAMILQPLTDLHSLCPTRILKVIPCYTIINYMNETIELLHPEDESLVDQPSFAVESKCSRAWHRPGNFPSTIVRLRCSSSTGSIGYFDLNEIGTTLLILPKKKKESDLEDENIHTSDDDDGIDWIVANIEVKFAEVKDQSYINIIIWRSCMKYYKDGSIDASIVSLSIKNDTDISFTIEQDGMDDILSTKIGESVKGSLSEVRSRYELCVKANKWQPFGWIDSNHPKVLAVSAGETPSKTGILSTIDTLLYEVEKVIDLSYCGSANIKLSLVTYGYGKVLHIYKDISENSTQKIEDNLADNWKDSSLTVKLLLKSISFSLFAEAPYRRELLSIHLEKFESKIQHSATNSKLKSANIIFELKLRDIQIDNYADTSIHPVLLTSACSEDRRKENKQKVRSQYLQSTRNIQSDVPSVPRDNESVKDEYQSFIECSMVREIHAHNKTSPIIKYFALRILEMNVSIDSSSILEYFIDLHQDIIYNPNLIDAKVLKMNKNNEINERRYQELDEKQVTHNFNDFNQKILKYLIRQSTSNAINVKRAYHHALVNKVSFESLIIHPIKVSLTFTPTSSTRFASDPIVQSTHKLRLLQGMHGIPAVEYFEVKIGSFIVNHAMESVTSMYRRILIKTRTELKSSLMSMGGNLLGSMSILGKPAGLLKNIGEGAQDLFYEPYLGSMISPSAFVLGIGKGTGAFIGGLATGVFGTTANVVVSATGGFSSAMASGVETLTGDDYYTRNREEKRRSIGASQGGVLVGMKTGGENLFTGVAAGLTGLVTKPIEEGKKTGALGFMKGVGMGLVGVAVKPVLGLTDGISSVASGFTQQITDSSTIANHYRPQRALERIDPCYYHNNSNSSNKLLIVPFDIFATDCQYFIKNKAFQNNYEDDYLASFKLGYKKSEYLSTNNEYGIAISLKYIYCMSSNNNLLWEILFTNLSHVIFKTTTDNQKKYMIECILYNTDLYTNTSEKSKIITCLNKIYAINLYSFFLTFSTKMGYPSKLIPIESLHIDDTTTSTTTVSTSIDSNNNIDIDKIVTSAIVIPYEFTNINPRFFPHQVLSDEQIINLAQENFQLINIPKSIIDISCMNNYYQLLDENIWHLLSNWKNNHHQYASRHSICLVINNSSHDIRLNELELKEGKGYHILTIDGNSTTTTTTTITNNNTTTNTTTTNNNNTTNNTSSITSYDKDSRTLVGNGGSLVIFVYGYTPSLTDLAHVKLKIYSSAFEMMITTRKNRSYCKEINENHVGFLCKTETSDFWSKFVIVIT